MVTTSQVLCLHILLTPKNKTEQRKQTNEKPYMSQTRIDANGRIKIWFRYSKEMYLLLPLIVCALHLKKLQIYQNERWKSLKFLSQSHGVAQIANTELGKSSKILLKSWYGRTLKKRRRQIRSFIRFPLNLKSLKYKANTSV